MVRGIGQRIRGERLAMHWTQRQAAERLGLKQPNLAAMEKGRVAPTVSVLDAVCGWRGRSLGWLLFGEEEPVTEVAEDSPPYQRAVRLPVGGTIVGSKDDTVAWRAADEDRRCSLPPGAEVIEVQVDMAAAVANRGQRLIAVEAPPQDGDLVLAELGDGHCVVARWWPRGKREVILARADGAPHEPPMVERRSNIHRVWRVIGILF